MFLSRCRPLVAVVVLLGLGAGARGDQSFAKVAEQVNTKIVKLFGSGGFRGLASYGTGLLVSPDGYILTVASPLLDTQDLRIHLHDGRRYHAKVVAQEPALDIALCKIDTKEKLDLPHFDMIADAKNPLVETGTGILGFSNQFNIATRDEPVSVQQGRIASYTKMHGRRGIHATPYSGNVYIIDAITNNPGAGGGVITTRKGQLLGLIGKELRNEQTMTWVNYAIPIQGAIEVVEDNGNKRTVSLVEVVTKRESYKITNIDRTVKKEENYHGITLVPNVVEFTPPYVEEVDKASPAAKAGLKPDDLIVYVEGEQINNINQFKEAISRIKPNTKIQIDVRRGDKLETLSLLMAQPLVRKVKPKAPEKPKDD